MKKVIEINEKCPKCKGTGLYQGMGERDGAAVVCYACKGTGCHQFRHEYEDFTERESAPGVRRVFETNTGICIGEGRGHKLSDFGGMLVAEWESGKLFPPGSENRQFTCPAWWYQSADYKKKPEWQECLACGAFSGCPKFIDKEQCWKRWDKEFLHNDRAHPPSERP